MTDANDTAPRFPQPLQDAIDKYREWGRHSLESEEAENKIVAPLYQYTDACGLRGIFESEQIWFTDYRHLNDQSELLHGMETARNIARQNRPNAKPQAQFFLDYFVDKFKPDNFDLEFYIASFSRARDDLGQWRAYADNGRGFAIGFAPRLFETTEYPPIGKAADFVGSVKYTPEDVNALYVPPILEAAAIFLSEALTNAELMENSSIGIPFMQEMVRELIVTLIWRSLTTKHVAYKNEEEVRLVIQGTRAKLLPYVKTRLRGSEIVPYIPQPWAAQELGNVIEIMIGPAASAGTERTLQKFLNTLGMDFEHISRSRIPYRVL